MGLTGPKRHFSQLTLIIADLYSVKSHKLLILDSLTGFANPGAAEDDHPDPVNVCH